MFLYDIREDALRRGSGTGEVYDGDGHLVARRSPPRWFQLTYLVTAWANRPQDEHRLLSQVLAALVAQDALPAPLLTGSLAELGLTVGLETAGAGMDAPAAADVWSALGGEMKASLGLRVRAPLAGVDRATAPPVTEGLVVRSAAARDGAAEEGTRAAGCATPRSPTPAATASPAPASARPPRPGAAAGDRQP